ncbi:hypothetical protein BaRGS_00001329, partial [Batillaria attramentaria]
PALSPRATAVCQWPDVPPSSCTCTNQGQTQRLRRDEFCGFPSRQREGFTRDRTTNTHSSLCMSLLITSLSALIQLLVQKPLSEAQPCSLGPS